MLVKSVIELILQVLVFESLREVACKVILLVNLCTNHSFFLSTLTIDAYVVSGTKGDCRGTYRYRKEYLV